MDKISVIAIPLIHEEREVLLDAHIFSGTDPLQDGPCCSLSALISSHKSCLYAAGDEGFAFWEGQIAKIRAKYERVIMLGDSMGATAALLFSHLATTVQAFTPQVGICCYSR